MYLVCTAFYFIYIYKYTILYVWFLCAPRRYMVKPSVRGSNIIPQSQQPMLQVRHITNVFFSPPTADFGSRTRVCMYVSNAPPNHFCAGIAAVGTVVAVARQDPPQLHVHQRHIVGFRGRLRQVSVRDDDENLAVIGGRRTP